MGCWEIITGRMSKHERCGCEISTLLCLCGFCFHVNDSLKALQKCNLSHRENLRNSFIVTADPSTWIYYKLAMNFSIFNILSYYVVNGLKHEKSTMVV